MNKYKKAKADIYDWLVSNEAIERTELYEKVSNESLELENLSVYGDGDGSYEVSFEILTPKIPDDALNVYGVEEKIITELKKKVWDRLSNAYNVYTNQRLFMEDDLKFSSQYPDLQIIIYKRGRENTEVEFSWKFEVHEMTVRNQKVLMNFFKFLSNNFGKFSESIFNEMSVVIDDILKNVPGPYYGKNWYDRSKIWEDKMKKEFDERTRLIRERSEQNGVKQDEMV
jgi:hypothetical protein